MTFTQFLQVKKEINVKGGDLAELMDEYYGEYNDYMMGLKDGCGPDE